jgi:hypothetical protein
MDKIPLFTSYALLGNKNHWIACMFLYLTVVEIKRRSDPRRSGTLLFELIVLTVMGFGGGIINPVLLGQVPFPMGSDVVIPCIVLAYFFVRLLGSDLMQMPGIYHLRHIAFELVRSKLIHGWCIKSAQIIPSTYFHQFPVFGVLTAGAIGGCGGLFLINGGLSPIKNAMPWSVESAVAASALHFVFANSLVSLPPVVSATLLSSEDVSTAAHFVIVVFLVLTRLVPITQKILPWRILSIFSTATTMSTIKKKSKDE